MQQLQDTTPRPDTTIRIVRVVAPLATLAMAAAVLVGLVTAPEGAASALLDNVWGRVTIFDLYLAFTATWIWIAWRERHPGRAVVWAVLIIVTGSVALWGYISWHAMRARDMNELLLGPADIVHR